MRFLKRVLIAGTILCVLLGVYVYALRMAYSIPNELIAQRVQEDVVVINNTGVYPRIGCGRRTQLDLFTDRHMLNSSIQTGDTALKKAMIPSYARYWHGYQVFLRPLLTLLNRQGIVKLYCVLFYALLLAAIYTVFRCIGSDVAIMFALSMGFSYCWAAPLSMQFMTVYVVSLIGVILSCRIDNSWILFLCLGSLVNFFDFLTFPLMSLGLPLIIILLRLMHNSNYSGRQGLNTVGEAVLSWGLGYSTTWIAKWIIASYVLKTSVIQNAIQASFFRVAGNSQYPVNYYEAVMRNVRVFLLGIGPKAGIVLLVLVLVIFRVKGILSFQGWRDFKSRCYYQWGRIVPLILVAVMPYIWYLILANHSQIHFWFTFRNQACTFFALGVVWLILYRNVHGDILTTSACMYWRRSSFIEKALLLVFCFFLFWY